MQILSLVVAGCSVILSVIVFATSRQDKHSIEIGELVQSTLKLNIKTDQICSTTNETRTDIKAMNNQMSEFKVELAVVKRDLKTAFNLIDEIKGEHNEKRDL